MTSREYPGAAFGLALAGGIIIILAGLLVAAVGAILTFFIAGLGGLFGLVGVFWGILIVVFASMLRSRPQQHVTWGILIIIMSLLSWFGSFGGFFLGFILALVGGIMALIWKPSMSSSGFQAPPPSSWSAMPGAPGAATGSVSFCPNCGAAVEAGAKFCKACGKAI